LPREDIKQRFIKLSGGCLRDLFTMIKSAASNALDDKREFIDEVDFTYGLNKLKSTYFFTISYNRQTGLDAEDYYKILVKCCRSRDKQPPDENGMMDLKHNLCILGYNTENWFDVHPVVKIILSEKGLIP